MTSAIVDEVVPGWAEPGIAARVSRLLTGDPRLGRGEAREQAVQWWRKRWVPLPAGVVSALEDVPDDRHVEVFTIAEKLNRDHGPYPPVGAVQLAVEVWRYGHVLTFHERQELVRHGRLLSADERQALVEQAERAMLDREAMARAASRATRRG